ncbi:MAG: hypothetical protein Q9210_002373 [Variospora velana]
MNGKKTPHHVFHEIIRVLGSFLKSCLLLHEKRKKKLTPAGFASVVIHLEILLSKFLDDIVEAIYTKNKYTKEPFGHIEAGRHNLLRHLRKGGQLP